MSTISLQKFRGAFALVGPIVNDLAQAALGDMQRVTYSPLDPKLYHITLATKDELQNLTPEQVNCIYHATPDTHHLFSAGVGGVVRQGVYWVVIIWAAGQKLRKQCGLPPKHFHITLSSNDIHEIDKGLGSLSGQPHRSYSPEFLDHASFTLFSFGQFKLAQEYSASLIVLDVGSYKGFLRLGDAALSDGQSKLAMLAYACAHERAADDKVKNYCLKKLIECSKGTEWGLVFQEDEITQLSSFPYISSHLLTPYSQNLRDVLGEQKLSPSLLLEPRNSMFIPSPTKSMGTCGFYKLPRFFRWLIPHHLAIMSTPRNEDDITALASASLGIRHVLTLTEETPLHQSWFRGKQITNTFLPIPNFYPPSIEQMDIIVRLIDDQKNIPLLIHCGGGKGRAGTVAACYLAAYGFQRPVPYQNHPELSAAEAISSLRSLRPGSLETSQQEAFVSKWCSTIWKRQSIYPELPSEPPPGPVEVEGSGLDEGDLFLLVGLPGSGKSFFANSLLSRNPSHWIYISQDDSGSRDSCETQIGRTQKGKRVILDRCNTSASDRKLWLELASNWSIAPICVWFDYDRDLCTSRAQMRADHSTLPPGSRVRNAVEQMQKAFIRPSLEEGFKSIVTIRSFAAAQEAILRLSPPLIILKFPRTPHLFDLGAATTDDIHADFSSFADVGGNVVITEKVDGANMGFSLSSDRSRILVQNRSHYINPSTHEQFKKLGHWVERHEEELKSILDRDPYFAERFIVYGEWMYATHSIPYTHLPDLFLAYDFFDRKTQTFLSTEGLHNLLQSTTIPSVPVLHEGKMPADADLLAMIQGKSAFYDGRVEGVYVKVEAKSSVQLRGKVVRSDFIAGNDHWTRGNLRVNTLRLS